MDVTKIRREQSDTRMISVAKWLICHVTAEAQKKLLEELFGTELQKRLHNAVKKWRTLIPADCHLDSIEMFLLYRPSNSLADAPIPLEVLSKLEKHRIPSGDDWYACLCRQRDWIISINIEPQPFFRASRERTDPLLRDLAQRLADEVPKETTYFQVDQYHRISAIEAGVQELVDAQRNQQSTEAVDISAISAQIVSSLLGRVALPEQREHSGHHAEIDAAVAYTKEGQPDVAIAQLQRLRRDRWDALSARERFRLVANIGHAYDRKGDYSTAASFFIECAQYQPDDEKARAYLALGLHISGEDERAFEVASKLCADFPGSDLAWSAWIRSATPTMRFEDVERSVPERVRKEIETAVALSTRARGGGNLDKSLSYARIALEQDRSNSGLIETLALVLVDIARHNAAKKGLARVPESAEAKEALALLNEAFAATRAYPLIAARIRFLLGLAYILADNEDAAEGHLRAAHDASPDNVEYARHLAIVLHERGNTSQAIGILKSVVQSDTSGRTALALACFLHIRNDENDRKEAISTLVSFLPRIDTLEMPLRHELVDMLISFQCDGDHFDDAEKVVMELSSETPEAVRLSLRSTIARRRKLDGASEFAVQAHEVLADDLHVRDKRRIAIELTLAGKFCRALSVWKNIAPPGECLADLPLIVRSAIGAGADRFLLRYLAKVRGSGFRHEDAINEEINILCRYSAFRRAARLISDEVTRDPNSSLSKVLRVRLLQICHLRGLKCQETASASTFPSVEEVDPRFVASVVQTLAIFVSQESAEEYAYEFLRRNFNSRAAHQAMILAVLFSRRGEQRGEPESVQIDSAVCCEDRQSGAKSWVIIESGGDPDIARSEYAPTHELAKKLLNKRVGEVVTIKEDAITKRDVLIAAIHSKYKYRFNVCMQAWERYFPDSTFLWTFDLKEDATGQLDFGPILQSLKEQRKAIREQEEFYRVNPLSVTTFAAMTRVTVLQAVQHLAESPELPIRCCRGNSEEVAAAIAGFGNNSGIVIDESALVTLFLSDSYGILQKLKRPIFILESTYTEFRKILLQERESKVVGRMFEVGGQPYLVEHQRSARKRHIAKLQDFLRTLRASAELVNGLSLGGFPRKRRKVLVGVFGRSGAETISYAARKNLVLWTDDLFLADSFAGKGGTNRVWSDFVFDRAVARQICDESLRSRLVAFLLRSGYFYTRITPQILVQIGETASWDAGNADIRAALRWFSLPETNSDWAQRIGGRSVLELWRHAPSPIRNAYFVSEVLKELRKRPDGLRILRHFRNDLPAICGPDYAAEQGIRDILKTMFM